MELEKRMKDDAVAKERERLPKQGVREEALAEVQHPGPERGTIAQLQEQDVAVASSIAIKDEADKFKVELMGDSWGGAPVISGKKKKGKKGHTAGLPPPPTPPPSAPTSPSPPSSPPNIQLEVERAEEERLQLEEEGRLGQERIAAEESERAAEEERARIEAEEVKAARIAAEEEEACCIAKDEAKASSG